MTRFIHTADWQLGMTRHFLAGDAQSRYAEARLEVIRKAAALAADEACDFVVVAGDVFESNQLDRQVVLRALDAIGGIGVPVYLLPGNHDPLLSAGSVWDSPIFVQWAPKNVVVLRDMTCMSVPGVDAEVVGAPWPSKHPGRDLIASCCEQLEPSSAPRVLVGHGAVDALSPDADALSLVQVGALESALGDGRLHYVALGDRHSTTSVGRSGRIWYSGTPLVTDYDELDPNNVLIVELDARDVSVTPVRVGDWSFERRRMELNSVEDVAALDAWLSGLSDKTRTVLRLGIVGTLSLASNARLEQVLDEHRHLLAALEIWDRETELALIPEEGEFGDLALAGFVADAAAELQELAVGGGDQALVAQDALGLLYRLSERDK